ncbi:YccF domain-containing protein [Pseudobutyrivibrio xylanivorans]|uniref:YccF domain-containing protein n=1 Tax=Pseudobutyrivibrio xylanivorans TaxID=185007 RepID=UPI002FE61286
MGGLLSAIGWWLAGALWCITIIGIPFGKQFFKIAGLALAPFGKDIVRVRRV